MREDESGQTRNIGKKEVQTREEEEDSYAIDKKYCRSNS